jgi:hypothetical protein
MAEISALRADISVLDNKYILKSEKQGIIQQSIAGAEALIIPAVGSLIFSQLAPVKAAISGIESGLAGLAAKIANVSSVATGAATKAGTALSTATSAANTAGSALARVASLAAALAALAASVATLLVLGSRIDALENYIDSVANSASKALSVAGQALGVGREASGKADRALDRANTADSTANRAFAKANTAEQVAADARAIANNSISKANTAINKATDAENIARQAYDGARQATTTANNAQDTANNALGTAERAIGAANTANQKAETANRTATDALSAARNATTIGNNALSKANSAQATANQALATARSIPAGKQGERGLQGIQGKQGERGLPGRVGSPGKDGVNGKDGKNGEDAKVDNATKALIKQIAANAAFIPALVARPAALNFSQTVTAAATGTCQTTKPGGCMNNMANNIANNTNNKLQQGFGNLSNLLNGLGIGKLIQDVATINTKLGVQIAGGISGKLNGMAQWLQLDRVLNTLTFAATVHNGVQLTGQIGESLGQSISNVLQLIGIKDDNNQPINVSQVIGNTVQGIIQGIVGAENYATLSTNWAKANRIYQASSNVLNAFQGLASSILTGLEMTAGKVAKIGNALRQAGEVLDSAYTWMNPQPKFNRITQTLENLQNGASTIQMITQAPLDVINATTELTNATTELTNAIKQDENPANKGTEAPEPDKLKADKAAEKLASAGKEIVDTDLDPDD